MIELPDYSDRDLMRLFDSERNNLDDDDERVSRILRRVRRETSATEFLGFTLVKIWLGLLQLCAVAFARAARARTADSPQLHNKD